MAKIFRPTNASPDPTPPTSRVESARQGGSSLVTASPTDPGATGAGTIWVDTTLNVQSVRNSANTGWTRLSQAPALNTPVAAGALIQSVPWAVIANGGTATWGVAPTNGNTLWAFIVSNNFTVVSLVQAGVTWTLVGTTDNHTGNVTVAEIWKGVVGAGAVVGTVVNFAGAGTQAIILQEYSGLSTADAVQSQFVYLPNGVGYYAQSAQMLAFPQAGGKAFLLEQNATGGGIATPVGWTPSTGTPFNYGGSGEGGLYTIDLSASNVQAVQSNVVRINGDAHVVVLMHCVP